MNIIGTRKVHTNILEGVSGNFSGKVKHLAFLHARMKEKEYDTARTERNKVRIFVVIFHSLRWGKWLQHFLSPY